MATCYDCIHCDACSDAGDSGFSCLKEDVSKCKHFKNKTDFVEVIKVAEMLCKIKTNIIENVSAMIENDFSKIVKDALGTKECD